MSLRRLRLQIEGQVQGVGFRPLAWTLAHQLQLSGFVRNDSAGVTLELQGTAASLEAFCQELQQRLPAPAHIDRMHRDIVDCQPDADFCILSSQSSGVGAGLPPDLAPCERCLKELSDPLDRRFAYPFLNCTACGPRYTIAEELPYDRVRTTMRNFPLCSDCQREYGDPADRRFHAQPLACPGCGPQLTSSLESILASLERGQLVGLKGVGGYHLLCRAQDISAVARLRQIKRRPHRPLALLVPDLEVACRLVHLPEGAQALLASPARPIVLATARVDPSAWAPGQTNLGVMLPYSPLHHLICREPLVATSANPSGEPIPIEPDPRLESMCDLLVHHNRRIAVGCDDSVFQWGPRGAVPVRRSRGYVPQPLSLSVNTRPTLALGGELKATLALTRGQQAWLSGHIGDVANLETARRLEDQAAHLERLLGLRPEVVVTDMHPAYLSHQLGRRMAQERNLKFRAVQHHHSHLASLLGEHQWPTDRPVLGIILDGAGWGPDGALWGGEVLRGGYAGYERVAHLGYLPLRGGDSAVRNPARLALEYLTASGVALDERLPCVAAATTTELRNAGLQPGLPTSSAGRLFDAVAALLGICQRCSYEGQAAAELEAACSDSARSLDFPLVGEEVDCRPALHELATAMLNGACPQELGGRFHNGLADLVLQLAQTFGSGLPIALSGGCFQNQRLLGSCLRRLEQGGFEVLIHQQVPPNDGGLALGQALIAQFEGETAHVPGNSRSGQRDL